MKDLPVLFSGAMVRAILDGRKTQTRRVVKPQPWPSARSGHYGPSHPSGSGGMHPASVIFSEHKTCEPPWAYLKPIVCPFGEPGDRLWVRETWQGPLVDDLDAYRAEPDNFKSPAFCDYAADGGTPPEFITVDDELVRRWRPSIHMPRWASRILLEVGDVRVERLLDCSDDDAWAEGCPDDAIGPLDWYRSLWDSLNAGRGYGWAENPWVWVVSFKRVQS